MAGRIRILFTLLILSLTQLAGGEVNQEKLDLIIASLVEKHGNVELERIERGVNQAARLWTPADGDGEAFHAFCLEHFTVGAEQRRRLLERFEYNLEMVYGHNLEINRELSRPIQLDIGPILPVDRLFAEYDPFAHINEDFFRNKIAFVGLLNFPHYTLEARLRLGEEWSREQWAQARLAQQFIRRVPADVLQRVARAYVRADDYIANYNICMDKLIGGGFPKGLKLITHWGLRDELKARYADDRALLRQSMIQTVMERIIKGEIPREVINNDELEWDPAGNRVLRSGVEQRFEPENGRRYQNLLNICSAERALDPFYPDLPGKIGRRFQQDREIPEQVFEQLIVSLLTDPVAREVAELIAQRLGRGLEPFDIWYNGFKPRRSLSETELDRLVATKYPTVEAFEDAVPAILRGLGFSEQRSAFLAQHIEVDPSRGAGHAMGAGRRGDKARLRTRIPQSGMNYKGYNIATHELGHNVEQVFSLNLVDHYTLNGVPNTAFTEAFAFVFQSRDLELLGFDADDPMAEHLKAVDVFWSTCEIGAVGLVDLKVWHWMYDHPEADAVALKEAVIDIAREVWNQYFAPLFGVRDVILLAIYSHMIDAGLYLPDYSIGHLIMFQIEQYLKDKPLGVEMERMCRLGALTPDAWMRAAVGAPISAAPLLEATRAAVRALSQ